MLSEKNCSIDGTEPRSAEAILRQTSISSINSNKTVASGLSGKDETIGHQRLMKRQFLSVIECGIMDSSGKRVFKHYSPYFGDMVEIFTAEEDPDKQILYRSSACGKKYGWSTNRIGMYLKRKKLECDGIYQATAYREKRSGTHGLKAGGYFISEQVSRMMEVEFRTFDVTKMRSSTSSPMSRSTSQNSLSRSSSPKLSTSSGRSFDCSTPDRGRVVSASPSHITPTRATIVARDVREHVSNSSAHPSPMYYIVPSPASSRISENHALTSAPPSGGSFGTQHTHLPQAPVVYFVSPEQIYHLQNIRADVPPPRMAATFPVGVSNRVWNTAASPNVAQAPSGLFEHPGAYNGLPVMQPGVWDSNSSPVDLTRRPEP